MLTNNLRRNARYHGGMTPGPSVTPAELLAQYQQTDLQDQGISLDQALSNVAIRITLTAGARAARKTAMRQARANPIQYQIEEAA